MTLGSSDKNLSFKRLSEQLMQLNVNSTTSSESPERKSRQTSCSTDSGIHFDQPSYSGSSRLEDDIEGEFLRELMSTRQLPYRDYICHRCGMRGHMIQHCPTKNPSIEPTPYQGDRRSIGFFRCSNCHRSWKSGNAFANQKQKCSVCSHTTFPHKMLPYRQS